MRKWTRWQDWVACIAGLALLLGPLWVAPPTRLGMAAMIILGALLGASALWSLAAPDSTVSEWSHALLGVLAFVAPWAFGYANMPAPAWISWLAGAIAFIVGLWALPAARHLHAAGVKH